MKRVAILLASTLLLPGISLAELKNENLLLSPPAGYKVGFQNKQGAMLLTELVPETETVKDWSEMLTVQIFQGMKNFSPQQFKGLMESTWRASCKEGGSSQVSKGEENGYSYSVWLQTCPLNAATGKPEMTWLKAIKGNDSFYVVQKAFRFEPSKEQVQQWVGYLRGVTVCDTRLADRACPKLEKVSQ